MGTALDGQKKDNPRHESPQTGATKMNNYLITIFKQDDSVEYHTLTYPSLNEATNGAWAILTKSKEEK